MKLSQKVFAIAAALLFLTIFIIVGFAIYRIDNVNFKYSAMEPIENWVEYRNDKVGVAIMHPKDWKVYLVEIPSMGGPSNIRSYNFTAIRSNKSGKSEGRVALSFSPASTEGANQPNLSWFEFDKPDENGRINVKLDEIIFKNAKLYLYGVTSKSNDVEISKVHLGTCKNTLCKEVADFGNGTYGIVHIYSTEGSLQERNPPIDISSDDFKIAVKIIKTIRFYKEYHFP